MTRVRGSGTHFRCDECRRLIPWDDDVSFRDLMSGKYPGDDAGNSHWFCYKCLDRIETMMMVIDDRYARRGIRLSSDALMVLTCDRLRIDVPRT